MNRLIISGATGAVGMAILKECIKEKIEVLVLCRKDSSRRDRIIKIARESNELISILDCSLGEMATMQNETGKTYDAFIHLAWDGTFGNTRNDMYLQNRNVRYALDAVEFAARFGCNTFIGAGSQAEYGRSNELLTSATPTNPENGYGIAKLCAGQMTRIRAEQLGLCHMWVRIASVYGPYDGVNTLISSLIRSLKAGESPKCTKGEQMWDYLYSEDAGRAFIKIAQNGMNGKVYVLGSGDIRPLKEYMEELRQIVNPTVEIQYGAVPYGEKQVMFLGTDISEIKNDCGWEPTVGFDEGIRRLISVNL